jgi:hypothetical protein
MANSSSLASTSGRPRSPNTWHGAEGRHPRDGRRSCATMPMESPRSICLWFRQSPSDCCTPFLILRHGRRQILWLGVTAHPTAEWIARQLTEACGWEPAPRFIIRDRDCIYGALFKRRLRAMGIRDRPTAPRSPWQNGHAERLIGSIRRECLDHVVVFGERHLRHILLSYMQYYNGDRTHLSLNKDAPIPRAVQAVGRILPTPILGGLHHQYVRT